LRRIEMEMRIVVPDAGGVGTLAVRLATEFGADRISLSPSRVEIGVRIADESDRTVLGVLETVECWLDEAGVASAEMWLGENSYRLARWAPVEVAQRPQSGRVRRRSRVAVPRRVSSPVGLGV
jgi:hypothetical protein